ncbi:gamma-glutamyltranspeptidase [Betaproteobacteria bacterium]|nr:gamma-glutamyltranspeptidase [Betaproteobacteria bacterium]
MKMNKVLAMAVLPSAIALLFAGCGGGGGSHHGTGTDPGAEPELIVDSDPNSCAFLADGSPVEVGSGEPGDPAVGVAGFHKGNKAKHSSKYMVVANTPLASKAGCEILKAGGSAVDAAVAVQAVLGLAEPQMTTIAGSAFLMYYDAKTKKVTAYDGREKAPAAANNYYLWCQDQNDAECQANSANNRPGAPVPSAQGSGRSIGVPGTMRMLGLAHSEHGKLPWNKLFDEGIKLAADGFPTPLRLANVLSGNTRNNLARDANAMSVFYHNNDTSQPYTAGEKMTNARYAKTLQTLAEQGADALYAGPIAEDIVKKAGQTAGDGVSTVPITPSLITLEDLANYKAIKRDPVCSIYRSAYYVCSMSPPSSGGIAIAQTLGILNNFPLSLYPPTDPEIDGGIPSVMGVHYVSEAERLAYADRDKYVADTDFIPLPGNGLSSMLDPAYLKSRAALISGKSLGVAPAGDLGDIPLGVDKTEEYGTSHFSIVDAYGNVVAMTTTVESTMGSFHMTDGGFMLSNQLTDFSAYPFSGGLPVANRIASNKRPRSTMAPTLVFNGTEPGDFLLATGSPGGGTIIQYVLKTVIGVLDWGLDAQQATSLNDIGAANSVSTSIDFSNSDKDLTGLRDGLIDMGHTVSTGNGSSGISTIRRFTKDGETILEGGVDPRMDGIILGNGAL